MNADDSYFNQLKEIELNEKEESDGFIKFLETIFPFTKGAEAPYSETLNYTPADTQDLVEQFYSKENSGWGFQKTVKKEYEDFNGKGPGTLYLSDNKGTAKFNFYPAPPKEWIEKQNLIHTRSEFAANFFIHAAPILSPFAMKTQPTNVVLQNQYGTKVKGPLPGSKGGKTLLQQRRDNNYIRKLNNETKKIEWIKKNRSDLFKSKSNDPINVTPKSDIVNNVVNKSPIDVRAIIKIAKRNKISYKQAEAYLEMLRTGIRPDIDIKPGSSMTKQLKESKDPNLTRGYRKGGIFDPNRDDTIMYTGSVDKDDIPMYDLNQIVHPSTIGKQNVIGTLLNKHGGLRGGRLNLKSVNARGHVDKRIIGAVFLTPYGKGGNFAAINRNKKSIAYQMFGSELEDFAKMGLTTEMKSGQPTTPVQGHHKDTPLAVVLPAFEGTVKESPRFQRFVNVFLEELNGLGDMPSNIEAVLGHVARDPDSPHALTHAFTNDVLGPSGEKFWTKEKLDQIVVYDKDGNAIGTKNDDLREKYIRDFVKDLLKSIQVLDNATKSYQVLFQKQRMTPEYITNWFEDKLPELRNTPFIGAYIPMMMDKFAVETVLEEAEDFQQLGSPPAEVRKANANEILRRIFKKKPEWRQWTVTERIWRMKEITGTPSLDYEDGWTYDQLSEYLARNWMASRKLEDLHKEVTSWEDVLNENDR